MGMQAWLLELLAIKLYEHDEVARREPEPYGLRRIGWQQLSEQRRQEYRRIALATPEPAFEKEVL